MNQTTAGSDTSALACEVCGRLPHPRKVRLALAKLTAVFPIELLLHAVVVYFHMSFVLTVTLLAVTTTVLVIWVVEPSAMRLLTRWLHAPTLHARKRLHGAESLWRVRATLHDRPGSLAAVTHGLAAVRATILERQVHGLADGVQDEIVLGAAEHVREEDLRDAIRRGGGVDIDVWRTTALALVDGQTKAQARLGLFYPPVSLEHDGKSAPMLGSYATVDLDERSRLGVIAIQDEAAALASVGDMRNQTFFVSLIAAALALIFGFFFAQMLTRPVRELAAGAQRIAAGDFSQRVMVLGRTELGELGTSFNQMTDQVERFIGDLQRSAEENRELFLGTVKALAAAIDGKDPYTRGHSERVSRFSVATAQALGLSDADTEKIRVSALLHDVGKIGIDDRVLKKPSALTDEEFEIMKSHPQKGYKIMSQIPAMRDFLPGMYMHHEMINGEGYPQGLQGEQIPMQARIVSVADTFDAMTTERPYQRAMELEAALTRLKSFIGTRYDGRVVAAFVAACEAGKIRPGVTRVIRKQSDFRNVQPVPLMPTPDSVIAVS